MEKFIQKLAKDAGKIVLSKFRKIRAVRSKDSPKDYVTSADLAATSFVINKIRKKFPGHHLITEERFSDNELTYGYTWILDPLDGTMAFVHGVPLFCTAIALLKDKEIIMSAVYDPVHDELFFAKRGQGAYLNGKKIKPVVRTKLWDCVGSWMFTWRINNRKQLSAAAYKIFLDKKIIFNRLPTITLNACYLAVGRMDFMFYRDFAIWDLAPGCLIMKEAGVNLANFQGKPWTIQDKGFIAARPVIYKQLYPILKKALKL